MSRNPHLSRGPSRVSIYLEMKLDAINLMDVGEAQEPALRFLQNAMGSRVLGIGLGIGV